MTAAAEARLDRHASGVLAASAQERSTAMSRPDRRQCVDGPSVQDEYAARHGRLDASHARSWTAGSMRLRSKGHDCRRTRGNSVQRSRRLAGLLSRVRRPAVCDPSRVGCEQLAAIRRQAATPAQLPLKRRALTKPLNTAGLAAALLWSSDEHCRRLRSQSRNARSAGEPQPSDRTERERCQTRRVPGEERVGDQLTQDASCDLDAGGRSLSARCSR